MKRLIRRFKSFLYWYTKFSSELLKKDLSLLAKIRLAYYLPFWLHDPMFFTKKKIFIKVNGIYYRVIDLDSLSIISPSYEHWMYDYFKPNEGDVVIDVGAHVGKYTFYAAKHVGESGRVIALEPSPDTYEALIDGIKKNGFTNIVALNYAAWSENTILTLYVSKAHGQTSIFKEHASKWNPILYEVSVKAIRLDDLITMLNIGKVDWIKIDAEGAEYNILLGAINILAKYKPKLIIEIAEENKEKIYELLLSHHHYEAIKMSDEDPRYVFFKPA